MMLFMDQGKIVGLAQKHSLPRQKVIVVNYS